MRGGVGRGLPGLHEAYAAILVVTQGWNEAASDGARNSGSTHCDSSNARYQAGNWHGWPGLSEALGSSVQCW
jgi:hypothetical protein